MLETYLLSAFSEYLCKLTSVLFYSETFSKKRETLVMLLKINATHIQALIFIEVDTHLFINVFWEIVLINIFWEKYIPSWFVSTFAYAWLIVTNILLRNIFWKTTVITFVKEFRHSYTTSNLHRTVLILRFSEISLQSFQRI